jgi:hypothetical protein
MLKLEESAMSMEIPGSRINVEATAFLRRAMTIAGIGHAAVTDAVLAGAAKAGLENGLYFVDQSEVWEWVYFWDRDDLPRA